MIYHVSLVREAIQITIPVTSSEQTSLAKVLRLQSSIKHNTWYSKSSNSARQIIHMKKGSRYQRVLNPNLWYVVWGPVVFARNRLVVDQLLLPRSMRSFSTWSIISTKQWPHIRFSKSFLFSKSKSILYSKISQSSTNMKKHSSMKCSFFFLYRQVVGTTMNIQRRHGLGLT